MTAADLPTLNAGLNALSALLLIQGYRRIKQGRDISHRRCMLAALAVSAVFLASYLTYHATAGSVPYPRHDWTRIVYFALLIPHAALAALNVPLALAAFWYAWRGRFCRHRRLARWAWPVWVFVSFTGVAVYAMLYRL